MILANVKFFEMISAPGLGECYHQGSKEEEEEEEEEEEGFFKADAANEEDPERDRATQEDFIRIPSHRIL